MITKIERQLIQREKNNKIFPVLRSSEHPATTWICIRNLFNRVEEMPAAPLFINQYSTMNITKSHIRICYSKILLSMVFWNYQLIIPIVNFPTVFTVSNTMSIIIMNNNDNSFYLFVCAMRIFPHICYAHIFHLVSHSFSLL